MTRTVHVTVTFRGTIPVEVPDDWEYDGTLGSITEHNDLDANDPSMELVDWDVREERE